MLTRFILSLCLLLASLASWCQSKIFKEVNSEVASILRIIKQDDAVVGYLLFTRLEEVSKDSFNYRISIMDENLNDIGQVNFRDEDLALKSVAFEQDILCLLYTKSSVRGAMDDSSNKKTVARKVQPMVMLQFLTLHGKIVNSHSFKTIISTTTYINASTSFLKSDQTQMLMDLQNISNRGFSFLYNDTEGTYLQVYKPDGSQLWSKKVEQNGRGNCMMTTEENIYLLERKKENKKNEYFNLVAYNISTGNSSDLMALKDKRGKALKIIEVDKDPITGTPFISGYITAPRGLKPTKLKQMARKGFGGIFTINVKGPNKKDIEEVYSYWDENTVAGVLPSGFFEAANGYSFFKRVYKDYQGNTCFVGYTLHRKIRTGGVIVSILGAPILMPPMFFIMNGYTKLNFTNAMLVTQNSDGQLSTQIVPCGASAFRNGNMPIEYLYLDDRAIAIVTNSETKNKFLVLEDQKNIMIYNTMKGKIVRSIPQKNGNSIISIASAKEGHIMVLEYNRKEKYSRLSIEQL